MERPGNRVELKIDTPSSMGGKEAANTLSVRKGRIVMTLNANAMAALRCRKTLTMQKVVVGESVRTIIREETFVIIFNWRMGPSYAFPSREY